jgi:hypothetical protein
MKLAGVGGGGVGGSRGRRIIVQSQKCKNICNRKENNWEYIRLASSVALICILVCYGQLRADMVTTYVYIARLLQCYTFQLT